MKLPRKKKIFGSTWRIMQVEYPMDEQLIPAHGQIFPFSKSIHIKENLPKDAKLKCYLEMIFKAAFFEAGLEADDEAFARQLLALFKMLPK